MIRNSLTTNIFDVDTQCLNSLIEGDVPLLEDFPVALPQGSSIIRCDEFLVPVWTAARVSLMIDKNEQEIIRMKISQ